MWVYGDLLRKRQINTMINNVDSIWRKFIGFLIIFADQTKVNTFNKYFIIVVLCYDFNGWLVVFNVPSTARSFTDGTSIYCPLRRM